ncbi:lysophospholipid acyltransferase family protein [Carboxylicivirga caseinilyticus]|uniref:lysophospholipid acyltransferase family protein n=1 Tax=Carboxylicivirga caseinilyticus TaxID=3417572 RepID=UPI003D354440|nr:lysophospholipid acyltransferase family protein [Marinilabiliaceae bacterium A049]
MLISDQSLKDVGVPVPTNPLFKKAIFSYLRVNRINHILDAAGENQQGLDFIQSLLKELNIHFHISERELRHIPVSGPFILMSNHPFGFLDGLIMMLIAGQRRPDFKVLANFFLKQFKPLSNFFIDLNPFESKNSMNMKGIRSAYHNIAEGRPIGLFPAGEVATMQKGFRRIEDKVWDAGIIRFMVNCNVPVIPMYFEGTNSLKFHLLGKIHPYLRTLTIPSEFFKYENKTVNVRIGAPIHPSELKEFDNLQKAGRYLRASLFGLGSKVDVKHHFRLTKRQKVQEPVINPVSTDLIKDELEGLRANNDLLFTKSNYEMFLADAHSIPNIIKELGRLREHTFRAVGEGTGHKIDIDEYDLYYLHLFIWDTKAEVIAGAYRLGPGDRIVDAYGSKGFYVTSLFDLDKELNPVLSQTLEMGRSFVVKEYQQKPLPLFLLWQGILHFLKQNHQYKYLLGPVSISNDFTQFSKDLLIAFIKKHHYDYELAKWVHSRMEFVVKTNQEDIEVVLERNSDDLQKLDKYISAIEPGYMKIPVLLKQYMRQNARIIGFNVDPKFNNSLDGLMILEIKNLPQSTFDFLKPKEE